MAIIFYLFKRVDGLDGCLVSRLLVSFFALTLSLHFSFLSLLGFLLTHSTSEGCLYTTVFLSFYFSDDETASEDKRYTISRMMVHSKFVSNIPKYNHTIDLPIISSVSAAPNQITRYSP
jgi:hypothetical protein